MSLKAFHIIFVTVSTLLAVGFGLWAILDYLKTAETPTLLAGIGSLAGAVLLVVYGLWFMRKLKNESIW